MGQVVDVIMECMPLIYRTIALKTSVSDTTGTGYTPVSLLQEADTDTERDRDHERDRNQEKTKSRPGVGNDDGSDLSSGHEE